MNVSVRADGAERVFAGLPDGVAWSRTDVERSHIDEQIRLWWGRPPVDVFFRASEFHDGVAARAVLQPFGSGRLPFLAATDLAVFKSLFDRPKDWLDIAAMAEACAIDVSDVADTLRSLVGEDERVHHLLAIDTS